MCLGTLGTPLPSGVSSKTPHIDLAPLICDFCYFFILWKNGQNRVFWTYNGANSSTRRQIENVLPTNFPPGSGLSNAPWIIPNGPQVSSKQFEKWFLRDKLPFWNNRLHIRMASITLICSDSQRSKQVKCTNLDMDAKIFEVVKMKKIFS